MDKLFGEDDPEVGFLSAGDLLIRQFSSASDGGPHVGGGKTTRSGAKGSGVGGTRMNRRQRHKHQQGSMSACPAFSRSLGPAAPREVTMGT